jgi:hypothetical protein
MRQHPPVTLRLDPRAIPAVRAAIDESLVELGRFLARARQEGYIHDPWLGDPISAEIADFYNTQVMDPREGAHAAMIAYEQELTRVRDTLKQMEDHYRRTEGENAALWGRRSHLA